MKSSLLIKTFFMALGFVLILVGIQKLRTQGLGNTAATLLGIENKNRSAQQNIETISWCETRVRKISGKNGLTVFEEDMKWMAKSKPKPQIMDYMKVEKWFVANCKAEVYPKNPAQFENEEFPVAWTIEFIKGHPITFKRARNGHYSWKGQVFLSPQLDFAFLDLAKLAGR